MFFYPTALATVYGRRPKFFMAEHSATAKGENCAYGPTLNICEYTFVTFFGIQSLLVISHLNSTKFIETGIIYSISDRKKECLCVLKQNS